MNKSSSTMPNPRLSLAQLLGGRELAVKVQLSGGCTMPTFTPGPWSVGNTNNIITDIAAPDYTKAVATVWTRRRDPMDSKITVPDAEGEANARLIAAAPALYAVAQMVALLGPSDDAGVEALKDQAREALALVEEA